MNSFPEAAAAASSGGLGARRAWTVLKNNARLCLRGAHEIATFGIAGGANGSPARATLKYPDGTQRALPSKGAFDVLAGGQVVLEAPGSGGYGDEAERDPTRMRERSKRRDI